MEKLFELWSLLTLQRRLRDNINVLAFEWQV